MAVGGGDQLSTLQADDPVRVGPYVLIRRLGSGGMGRVFLARSPGGRLVAVKVIRASLADDDGFRARFAREVAAARKVGGLFTAQLIDADLVGPVPWLATAYVPGTSLWDAVLQQGPLPPPSVRALAGGLAEGLSAIHAAGVIHRDLKPSNVLLGQDGPRIIDFGISSAVDATTLTNTGFMIGSPGFMSPEQAEGFTVGPASDIFSLASVLVFAARGEGPFGIGETTALLYRVVHGKPNMDKMPDDLRPLIRRSLARDAKRRPTAAEFLAELAAVYPAAAELPNWLPPRGSDVSGEQAAAVEQAAAADAGEDEPQVSPAAEAAADQWYQPATTPRPRGPRPRWLLPAIAAAVILVVVVTLVLTLGGNSVKAPVAGPTSSPAPASSPSRSVAPIANPTPTVGELPLTQFQVGDCLAGANMRLNQSTPWPRSTMAVPCGQSHTAEVFYSNATFWPAKGSYPGDGAIKRRAGLECDDAFQAYIGAPYAKSRYAWADIVPDSSSWPNGDRALRCVAFYPTKSLPAGHPLIRSIKGARQ
jgi:hypothetical protein